MRKFSLIILMAASLMACEEGNDTAYNRGYSDGYAVGYNTACKIRATLIAGDWSNAHYSRGYADGKNAGKKDCKGR